MKHLLWGAAFGMAFIDLAHGEMPSLEAYALAILGTVVAIYDLLVTTVLALTGRLKE